MACERRDGGEGAFTLLGTLFVVVILAGLFLVAVVALDDSTGSVSGRRLPSALVPDQAPANGSGGPRPAGPLQAASASSCRTDYRTVVTAVAAWEARTGARPDSIADLSREGFLSALPANPAYRIELGPGPDGRPGTVLVNGVAGEEGCDRAPPR
ncbi:MAG TPA: hypothetical protein VHE80_07390 [Acidimicrobiales bacterium]|nr:hypothetical protein [Acidimicrobiales bacterium]